MRGSDFIGARVPELLPHASLHLKCISSYIFKIICLESHLSLWSLNGVELDFWTSCWTLAHDMSENKLDTKGLHISSNSTLFRTHGPNLK